MLDALLLRLLVGVLVFWLGEKVIALVKKEEFREILMVVLLIGVVLYVIFGSVLFLK